MRAIASVSTKRPPPAAPSPSARSSALMKPWSNAGVVRDQRRVADELKKLLPTSAKRLWLQQKLERQPVHAHDFFRHVAFGVEIGVKLAPGALEIEHLDAADLDDAVAQLPSPVIGEDARGFRIEHDFAHESGANPVRAARPAPP